MLRIPLAMFLALSVSVSTIHAQEPATKATTTPTTKSTTATIADDAKPVLVAIDKAYLALQSLEVAGTFSFDADVSGQTESHRIPFTSQFTAPALLRHTAEGDASVGSTGDRLFAYLPHRNVFVAKETKTADKLEVKDLPEGMLAVLSAQNPTALLAIAKQPSAALAHGYTAVAKKPDTDIDGKSFLTLELKADHEIATALFDPQTHLLRRFTSDLRPMMTQRGADDVKKAMYVVDYTTVNPTAAVANTIFAWKPPEGARDVSKGLREHGSAGDAEGAVAELVGKPAPDFTLPTLTDESVKLAELKDKVVVLDFWATWCGPCMVSLPHLNTMHEKFVADETKATVIAINVGEQKDHVAKVVAEKKWTMTVGLDTDSAVLESYGVTGLPTTIVIDQAGIVRNVFIGAGRQNEIDKAVSELSK